MRYVLLGLLLCPLLISCDAYDAERKVEGVIGIELPSNFELKTNDWFAGPGDFLEQYELVFLPAEFNQLTKRINLSDWEKDAQGGYTRQVNTKEGEVILYLNPSRYSILYVRPDQD